MTEAGQDLLLHMLEQLHKDLAGEREVSRQSRAVQHSRIDEVIERLGRIDTTIAVAGQVDAQVRTELDALKQVVIVEIKPTVDEWRRMQKLGLGVVGLMATGGLTVGAFVHWGGDQLVTAIRHFLHIQP